MLTVYVNSMQTSKKVKRVTERVAQDGGINNYYVSYKVGGITEHFRPGFRKT